jgi:hypothetical protein
VFVRSSRQVACYVDVFDPAALVVAFKLLVRSWSWELNYIHRTISAHFISLCAEKQVYGEMPSFSFRLTAYG